jgi:hypothetical protein
MLSFLIELIYIKESKFVRVNLLTLCKQGILPSAQMSSANFLSLTYIFINIHAKTMGDKQFGTRQYARARNQDVFNDIFSQYLFYLYLRRQSLQSILILDKGV